MKKKKKTKKIKGIDHFYSSLKKLKRVESLATNMPSPAKTHGQLHSSVCLICFQKGSSMLTLIEGLTLTRLRKYFFAKYNPDDVKLPCRTCTRCRNLLLKVDKGKLSNLPFLILLIFQHWSSLALLDLLV